MALGIASGYLGIDAKAGVSGRDIAFQCQHVGWAGAGLDNKRSVRRPSLRGHEI